MPNPDSYDRVPYVSRSIPQMHPDHLAMAARLRGLQPRDLARCRVLELGCADGAHLIPIAASFPDSHFVGVDASAVQVQNGQALIAALGLRNIELHAADFMHFPRTDGPPTEPFDYILCHGVYSWVPPPVQVRVLQICQQYLAPEGLAYISYNIYPGFYRRQHIMEMMRYHTAGLSDPTEIVRQARSLLKFLIESAPDPDSTGVRLLREEAQRIGPLPDSYVFHEHYEADNRPCYFHEFMREASTHGMQYVGDAIVTLGLSGLSPTVRQVFAQLGEDVVRQEQYLDFLRSTSLRSSILCRSGLKMRAEPAPDTLRDLCVLNMAVPDSLEALTGDKLRQPIPVKFRARLGEGQIDNPAFKALLLALFRSRPLALTMPELAKVMTELLGEPVSEESALQLATYGHRTGICMLRSYHPPLTKQVGERPRTTPLARAQAQRGDWATGPWHEPVALNPLQRTLLVLLDGSRDLEALTAGVMEAVRAGFLAIRGPNDEPVPEIEMAKNLRSQFIPHTLRSLAELGFLHA